MDWAERTPWGDPDLQGEWTSEGECGVPFERPVQFGTRQFLSDDEYAKRIEEVRLRDERDLAPVDVLSGKVDAPTAADPALARIQHHLAAHLPRDRPIGWTSPAANAAEQAVSRAAALRQPAARRAV
jgi:hypothetical protein